MENINNLQTTIKKSVTFSGIGLHSGKYIEVTLRPALIDKGIVFIRKDNLDFTEIKAFYKNISNSQLCTTLKDPNSEKLIYTVEHLLAAIAGRGIDNIIIELNGEEVPALDGSAEQFDLMIKKAEIVKQESRKKYLVINKKIKIISENRYILLEPYDGLKINCTIDFPLPIGKQKLVLGNSLNYIYENIYKARTFCQYEDIQSMKKNGLALGGSLDNALVIKDGLLLNKSGLRYRDEYVKHKTLDLIGDFSLLGYPLKASITAFCPGHGINKKMMEAIFSDYDNYKLQASDNSRVWKESESNSSINLAIA